MSSPEERGIPRVTQEAVERDILQQPYLQARLAENALTVAESMRGNYFKNTARLVTMLRKAVRQFASGQRDDPILDVQSADGLSWSALQNEVVTFIDGGVGSVQVASQVPILLRVGSYCVRTGERRITEREHFGYYPVILGDLQGGSRDRKDFIDIVRISAELLGGLSALERTPDLRVLMFHGPLVYLVGNYAGHAPFTESDIDLFLRQYASDPQAGRALKDQFLAEAASQIYPRMMEHAEWAERRLFEPLAWMSYLYRRLVRSATSRSPRPIIAGVVERGALGEFSRDILLQRVFDKLAENGRRNYFNELYGLTDLTSPERLMDKFSYTDGLLLMMLMQPGQRSEAWCVNKYSGLRRSETRLHDRPGVHVVDFAALRPGERIGFPSVQACYVQTTKNTEPVRVEVFEDLGPEQIRDAAERVYLYSRLLPGYGFPVGLDVADKYAKVPAWLTSAYGKLIRHHLGVSLQRGEVTDAEMRRILTQAIYMTHRDFLFRPTP